MSEATTPYRSWKNSELFVPIGMIVILVALVAFVLGANSHDRHRRDFDSVLPGCSDKACSCKQVPVGPSKRRGDVGHAK